MILGDILASIDRFGPVVRVTITHCLGSSPREAGADMIVGAADFNGSIGGGKLEFMALQQARSMIEQGPGTAGSWPRRTDNFVLGEELRQCCGGVVWLLFEYFDAGHKPALRHLSETLSQDVVGAVLVHEIESTGPLLVEHTACAPVMLKDADGRANRFVEPVHRLATPLVIYGAGHVGRALVRVLEGTPFAVTWVDITLERFPESVRDDVESVILANPADHVQAARVGAFHVVMSHSHSLDLDICRAVLMTGSAGYLGLIASKTKKSKFLNRLRKDGVPDSALNVFHCPIGLGHWSSKQPSVIAISIAAQLIEVFEQGLVSLGNTERKQIRVVGGVT